MTQEQLLGLDESHLDLVGRGPHRLTAATAAAFNDMQVAAAHEGHNLQAASSWRSTSARRCSNPGITAPSLCSRSA